MMTDESTIEGWHAHIYYEPGDRAQAEALCTAASDLFDLRMGRLHDDPVGPHPTGSCQLTVPPDRIGPVLGWLALNRGDLVVFAHAETGDVLADHIDHVIWLGESRRLRLDVLRKLTGN